MGDCIAIDPAEKHVMYKAGSGGIRFQMRTAGLSPEIMLIASHSPYNSLYKVTLGQETKIHNLNDQQEEKFPSRSVTNFHEFREYYVTWYSNKIRIGIIDEPPFVEYDRIYTEPSIGFVQFKTVCRHSTPVEWIIETSPVVLKSVPTKVFHEALEWLPMIDGKLPPDAMIGGFENEFIYIARSHHNNSLCPGKYVPSKGKAFVPWGHREHHKEEFEILCGYDAKWVKTTSNNIPLNAYVGGHSEVHHEPLYIGRAMFDGKLLCGKVHVRYSTCYLPCDGKEVEVSSYEILVLPGHEFPHALPFISGTPCLERN